MSYPLGNVWPVGDSKFDGVTDPPGSCGPRDPMWGNFISKVGGAFVGTLTGGADGFGGILTPCPISGLPLAGDGHPGDHCLDITQGVAGWYGSIPVPKVAINYVGTNDLIAIADAAPGFNIDRLYSDWATQFATCFALNTAVTWFVCNLDQMPALLAAVPAQLAAINSFIGAQVKQYQRQGAQVYLIDLAGAVGITYNSGGIHQDVAGYAVTGARMVTAMQTLRPAG